MAIRNTIERQIVPDLPKVIDNEKINVYVPIASGSNVGFAKYNLEDFIVNSDGLVKLKYPLKSLIKDANPLVIPSFVKLLDSEFERTFSNINYINAEVRLIRSRRDAKVKPDFVMLDVNDFEKRDYDSDQFAINPSYNNETGYNYYKLARNNPYNIETVMKIDPNHFSYNIAGDARLRIRYPYATDGGTTFSTTIPSNGYGLIKPRLDWFKFNTVEGSTDLGAMYFDQNYLLNFLNNPETNPIIPEVMPIYGAVRDLQPWSNKDLFYATDAMLRPYAIRDTDTDVTGSQPSNRIRIELTKEAIGLSKLANKYFSDWTYSDFGLVMQQHFVNQFGSKLDKTTWNSKFSDWLNSLTPYQWLIELEGEIAGIQASINLQLLDRGVYPNPSSLPVTTKLGEYALVLSTNTVWYINSEMTWIDSGKPIAEWQNEMETNAAAYLPNGVASAGISGRWSQSDHVHPIDVTRHSRVRANTLGIVVNNEPPADVFVPDGDFLVKLTPDYEDLPIDFIRLDIPYVPESKYLHNWKGQPSNDDFQKGRFVRLWVGSKQDFADDFGGITPDDVLTYITDDYTYADGNIFSGIDVENLINERISVERYRGWSQNGALTANINYILRTLENGGEVSMVPLDLTAVLAPYLKHNISVAGEGELTELANEYYTINGKRILTISASGEIGVSTDEGATGQTLSYKGTELLVKPVVSSGSLFLYKNTGFSQLTRADVDSVYSLSVNPMVLPERLLNAPPVNIVGPVTYTSISDMILGVDVRTANKMPLTTSSQGSDANSVFFAKRNGIWEQFTRALNINSSQSLIGVAGDDVGSIGRDLYDINKKAADARLSTAVVTYQSSGYGYDAYAGSDISIPLAVDWQNLLTPQSGPQVTNNRRGDAIIARRIGLTSDNLTGNNRSSFNMRIIECRDATHRNTIYNAMGVDSDRDNVLFMWPEN